ncbi:hypothetical protein E2562_032605 [Oryza meyeriana var. granulata]|uniref:DUF834 domain-containing protein n=1 Tax=Oryza meyeriana var. granulata TaxID=110450 RepID=A0A6G1E5U2_9ORYZ|nr:hypothetical protein E2562_032605 [Oryza meyeriana var. granulata]
MARRRRRPPGNGGGDDPRRLRVVAAGARSSREAAATPAEAGDGAATAGWRGGDGELLGLKTTAALRRRLASRRGTPRCCSMRRMRW